MLSVTLPLALMLNLLVGVVSDKFLQSTLGQSGSYFWIYDSKLQVMCVSRYIIKVRKYFNGSENVCLYFFVFNAFLTVKKSQKYTA